MKKPLIGVVPLYDGKRNSYWMLPGYMKGIEAAGGIPVMMPLTTDREVLRALMERFDGVLLTGGHDVSPLLYGEPVSDRCGEICDERDDMERILLDLALETDKTVLGICRGIQFLNVYLGGSLYQDLPSERPESVNHQMTAPYDRTIHGVRVERASPLYELLGKEELGVNSYHHQAVKCLAPGLVPMAYSEDGLVEAVYLPEKKFIWAVQWHPELSYRTDESSRKIIHKFVASAAAE